jgi:hypothetical protein
MRQTHHLSEPKEHTHGEGTVQAFPLPLVEISKAERNTYPVGT